MLRTCTNWMGRPVRSSDICDRICAPVGPLEGMEAHPCSIAATSNSAGTAQRRVERGREVLEWVTFGYPRSIAARQEMRAGQAIVDRPIHANRCNYLMAFPLMIFRSQEPPVDGREGAGAVWPDAALLTMGSPK